MWFEFSRECYHSTPMFSFSPWLDFGLSPRCPQVAWFHWEIESFSATLAQDGLVECDQPEKSREILRHGWELNPDHGEDRR